MTSIIGISAFYHDSAAALIVNGKIVAAAQEERFTRIKHDPSYPKNAISYVLSEAGLSLEDIDHIVFYDKPFLTFERLLETYIANAPKGFESFRIAMPLWLREKLFLKEMLSKALKKQNANFDPTDRLAFSEHHFSHAASAFYPSAFEEAIILTVDGVGEWATTSVAIGRGNNIEVIKEIHFPHSLGLLYSAFTYYTGFKVNSGEYKLMGLAPYGEPRFKDQILANIIDVKNDGSFWLNQSYFNYATGLTMTNSKFHDLFGAPPRNPEEDELTQFHMDIAASVQAVTEEILLRMTRSLSEEYGIFNLCLAGGVALNCVANGKILRDKAFKNLWIQPAAGDAGSAIGAALGFWYSEMGQKRVVRKCGDEMRGTYLGPHFSQNEIDAALKQSGAIFETLPENTVITTTADALSNGKAVGWYQGRMEFGPRALGNRSILGDPRSKTMQKTLNLKVKFRESFRPFAPSVLREDVSDWFDLDQESPYMLIVSEVKEEHREYPPTNQKTPVGTDKINEVRSRIPAVTHVDYSARIHTVDKELNPKYYALLTQFKMLTGVPILVNTSFNVRGEPIVNSPEDAFRCFMGTDLDMLVCGNAVLYKNKQDASIAENYKDKYELD